jgi:hypothetical protein
MKHIEIPTIEEDLVEFIKSTEINDIDEIVEQAIEIAVNIDQMPRDCEMENEDLACLFLAWNDNFDHFSDVLGIAGVDPTLISELGFINCCILEALDER